MENRAHRDLTEDDLERIFLALRNISHISNIFSKYLQKNFNVTNSQLLCLRTLRNGGPLSAGEIARRIFIKPGTVTGIIDRLETRGLVRRLRISPDRRVVTVEITEAGQFLVASAPVPIQSQLAMNLRKLPIEEVEVIIMGLERLLRLMQAEELVPEAPLVVSEPPVI